MGNMDSPSVKLVMGFLESGLEAAEIDFSPFGLNSASSAIRAVCHKAQLPVKCLQRQKRFFLVRTDLKKEGE